MSDFLAEKRRELAARRDEIEPLALEFAHLETAIEALDKVQAPAAVPSSNGAGTPRKRPRKRGRPRATGAGRKKGSGKRAAQAIDIIAGAGAKGITLAGVAQRMGIQPNYLYRVLPPLEAQGKIMKGDHGLYRSA